MIDKYQQAFQEEAREVLLELESALLELNERRDDPELVGRAFRALHTIKGSGSMFGFDEVAAFTHHVENAFDRVRSGRLAATTDLISLTLAAVDQIKAMLDEASGQGSADDAISATLLAKLRELTGEPETHPAKETPIVPAAPPIAMVGEAHDWHLRLSPKAVRARAIERGLIGADVRLSESEVFSLILTPGFSTAPEITDVSGRGVGMDVVRRNIEALRGTIEIASQPGTGSTVTLRLPLTLAIIDGLLVRVGETRFIMLLSDTVECVELTRQDIENACGKKVAYIRGEIVPYIRLSEHLQIHSERPEREQVMVAETEHGRFGFVVDQVLGDHQTAIKNLGRLYRNVQVVSGATILGDGTVALILDLHRMVQETIRMMSVGPSARTRVPSAQLVA